MSLMASHVTLRGCGLCIVDPDRCDANRKGEEDRASAPILEYCCRGYDGSEILTLADNFEVESNVYTRGGEELGPAVIRQVQGLLLEDKAYHAKGRVVYSLSAGSHTQHHHSASSSSADMAEGESSGAKEGDLVEEQVWLVPVKTSRHIHAVLRIGVSIHKDPTGVRNINKDVAQEGEYDDDEEDDTAGRSKMPPQSAVPPPPRSYAPSCYPRNSHSRQRRIKY